MPARGPPEANGKLNVFVFCIHCQRKAQGGTVLQLLNLFPVPYGSVDANVRRLKKNLSVLRADLNVHQFRQQITSKQCIFIQGYQGSNCSGSLAVKW